MNKETRKQPNKCLSKGESINIYNTEYLCNRIPVSTAVSELEGHTSKCIDLNKVMFVKNTTCEKIKRLLSFMQCHKRQTLS